MEDTERNHPEPWVTQDKPVLGIVRRAVRARISRDTKFRLYFRMLDTPLLSELYIRGRGRLRNRRLQPGTRLVIEAFPSSGNTYCRQAVLLSNPDIAPNDICSHTHSPRVVERAVRAGVPCIVVVRDPRDAVSSTVQRFKGIRAKSAFDYYTHYYDKLLPLKQQFVVAAFQTVVEDFSSIVARCNDQHGTAFKTETDAGVSSEMVLTDIEDRTRRKRGGEIKEATISRPSSRRQPSWELLAHLDPPGRAAMERALGAYHRFLSH